MKSLKEKLLIESSLKWSQEFKNHLLDSLNKWAGDNKIKNHNKTIKDIVGCKETPVCGYVIQILGPQYAIKKELANGGEEVSANQYGKEFTTADITKDSFGSMFCYGIKLRNESVCWSKESGVFKIKTYVGFDNSRIYQPGCGAPTYIWGLDCEVDTLKEAKQLVVKIANDMRDKKVGDTLSEMADEYLKATKNVDYHDKPKYQYTWDDVLERAHKNDSKSDKNKFFFIEKPANPRPEDKKAIDELVEILNNYDIVEGK